MKLNIKSGEHIRVAHDGGAVGKFRLHIDGGAVHITALSADADAHEITIGDHEPQPVPAFLRREAA